MKEKNVSNENSEKNGSESQLTKAFEGTTAGVIVEIAKGSWGSYPKIYNLGHRALTNLLDDAVIVEEKIDGSQFSFGKFLDPETGEHFLRCRSKGAEINIFAPDGMFKKAVETALRLFPILELGWTYRCEYLQRPKHNVLAYDRAPESNLILFDVSCGGEHYLARFEKEEEAKRLGLEIVPVLFIGKITDVQTFRDFLDHVSILGGQKVEGVVVKNYSRYGIDGRILLGKFVSESFKEIHASDWKERNPKGGDILQILGEKYRTPARWAKAVQHLREAGQIENSPRDIGKLIPEIVKDVQDECTPEIQSALFHWAWPHIRRQLTHGFPEWYKDELLKHQFNAE